MVPLRVGVVVAGSVSRFGVSSFYLVTMIAGVILVVLGATGAGAAVTSLPRPSRIHVSN